MMKFLDDGGTIAKLKHTSEIQIIFMTNGVSARLIKIKKKKYVQRKKSSLKLFNYLNITKPSFYNFPDNQMDKVPLLKIVKKIEKKN